MTDANNQNTSGNDTPPAPRSSAMDPAMKEAVEAAVAAALGKIPGLKELVSSQEGQVVPPRQPTQTVQSSEEPGPSTRPQGKYIRVTQVAGGSLWGLWKFVLSLLGENC